MYRKYTHIDVPMYDDTYLDLPNYIGYKSTFVI